LPTPCDVPTRDDAADVVAETFLQASPTQTAERQGDVFGSGIAASCVDVYGPQTLAKRSFGFDGTVESVGKSSACGSEVIDPYVPVVIHVNR
jgi:hypothetical protein